MMTAMGGPALPAEAMTTDVMPERIAQYQALRKQLAQSQGDASIKAGSLRLMGLPKPPPPRMSSMPKPPGL
jgi:hypothetical protein